MTRGRRLLPGSLRFRLTAWYALLLAGVLAVLGVSVMGLAEDRLNKDVNHRLDRTAEDISANVEAHMRARSKTYEGWDAKIEKDMVDLRFFASRGLLIQIIDPYHTVVEHSESASQTRLLSYINLPDSATPYSRTVQMDDEQVRLVSHPISLPDRDGGPSTLGWVIVGERLEPLYETLASFREILIATSGAGLALAVLGGWLLADRALRPVDRITAAAASIADGDGTASSLGTRLDVPDTGDELARLSGTFNAMLDRLQAAFVAQQRFVADASHELRTPLTAIRGNLDVLARQVAALRAANGLGGDLDAAVTDMKRESARMGRLLEDLLLLARSDAPEGVSLNARPVRLDDVARDAVRTAAPLAAGQVLEVDAPEAVTVSGDPDRLLQLLLILIENALRHTPAGARVAVEVTPPADGVVQVAVRDEGEGIAPEHLPHLFERFYRADGARGRATGGTGLGLAIAETIVRAHGGRIGAESAPGRGSIFTITLPAAPTAASDREAPDDPPDPTPTQGPLVGIAPPVKGD